MLKFNIISGVLPCALLDKMKLLFPYLLQNGNMMFFWNYGTGSVMIHKNTLQSLTVLRSSRMKIAVPRDSVRSTRGLGPTMTARGQSIGISTGILPQTLIMSITVQKTSKYYTTEFDREEGF